MDRLLPVLTVLASGVAWTWFLYRRSGRRMWKPLWLAFSASALALLFVVAGVIGYRLDPHDRFIAGSAWAHAVIWWEVGVGLGVLPLAAFFWRNDLQNRG